MAAPNDTASMALFCDFENIALGVRDAQYEKFDIRPVLERLLAKGSIVVKKAYCDWERYKGFKAAMHESNFELIEIPHVRQSGKNSADIRMVVDALDLCYTKSHVDTFVIISGDSDFSPLVSKLRENAKRVIGVGVKQSCSDLLVTNCDEFIYYDDLVRDRDGDRSAQRREREKRSPEEEAKRREKQEERKAKAVDIVSATFVDLMADRGESDRIWASVLKEVVKRRNPGFNENYYGFRSFGNLLEEAAQRGLLGFGRDDKGAFVFRAQPRPAAVELPESEAPAETVAAEALPAEAGPTEAAPVAEGAAHEAEAPAGGHSRRRGGRRGRKEGRERLPTELAAVAAGEPIVVVVESALTDSAPAEAHAPAPAEAAGEKPRRGRQPRKPSGKPSEKPGANKAEQQAEKPAPAEPAAEAVAAAPVVAEAPAEAGEPAAKGRGKGTAKKTGAKKAAGKKAAAETPAGDGGERPEAVAKADGQEPAAAKPAKAKRPARPRKAKAAEAAEG